MGRDRIERKTPLIDTRQVLAPETSAWLERLFTIGGCHGRILVVDDDAMMRGLFQFILKREGYFVREGGNGIECVKLAKTMRPNVILLNYLMPMMDGLMALKCIKTDPTTVYLKVIMYSAVGSQSPFWASAEESGAFCCLQTPFPIRTLLATIERCMRSP